MMHLNNMKADVALSLTGVGAVITLEGLNFGVHFQVGKELHSSDESLVAVKALQIGFIVSL